MKKILSYGLLILILISSLIPIVIGYSRNIYVLRNEIDELKNISQQSLIKTSTSGDFVVGEKIDPIYYSKGFVEHMDDAVARDLIKRSNLDGHIKEDNSRHGIWIVPSKGATYSPYSGYHNVINKWGDTKMGIAFPKKVDIHGAWFAGQGGGEGLWADSIRINGYYNGELVQTTDWFEDIDDTPTWFPINLLDVDRIVIEANPVFKGGGWYSMDDLTYIPKTEIEQGQSAPITVDFEDCTFKQILTDSNYAGLTWETGTGSLYVDQDVIHSPILSPYINTDELSSLDIFESGSSVNNLATAPDLISDFQGVIRGDAESWSYPPDTCGAAGYNHFVEVVNRNFAVYNKSTGEQLINIHLNSFLPGGNGDPRVLFDQYSNRWFVIDTDFNTRVYLAVSTSDDPTGSWFKCNFVVSLGSDAGKWPDYPTLGVDAVGIYVAAYMIGGSYMMSIFALDKAPLIAPDPSIGTVYAFRELPWEGAIQPVHTFGTTEGEYFVSRCSTSSIRLRQLTNLLSNPILTELGYITIPSHYEPPDAPALGSTVPLDTVGHRLMNAVYRNGYIWTAHCINVDGRAASRWYKINTAETSLDDYGTVSDSVMYYFFPSIMVNEAGDVVMGFSGSHSGQYASAYYTGRSANDPPGEMAPPVLLKAGEATYNLIDGYGRNRWGDYSLCSLDPINERTFWTIQEYAHSHCYDGTNRWGTWVGELDFGNLPPETPIIDGPTDGIYGEEYDYTFITTDENDHNVSYYIEWGDGEFEEWIGPYNSGEEVIVSHTWDEQGEYTIRAKAKDIFEDESEWGYLEVTMPMNQQSYSYSYPLLQKIFDRFPSAFPILRFLLTL